MVCPRRVPIHAKPLFQNEDLKNYNALFPSWLNKTAQINNYTTILFRFRIIFLLFSMLEQNSILIVDVVKTYNTFLWCLPSLWERPFLSPKFQFSSVSNIILPRGGKSATPRVFHASSILLKLSSISAGLFEATATRLSPDTAVHF